MVNAQQWLDENYPKNQRSEIVELIINNKGLENELNLDDFINLERLDCFDNFLTNIAISPDNLMSLKNIDLSNNNIVTQDLSFLSIFVNLEEIRLGNLDQEKITKNIYNRFVGSLDYLSEIKKLKILSIINTDISEFDINKLPKSLEKIEHSIESRLEFKLTDFNKKLEKYKWGFCKNCQSPNDDFKWCQICTEREWQNNIKNLTGEEVIKKFIQKQHLRKNEVMALRSKSMLEWIPYEQFYDIKYLTEGGFGKVYKVKRKYKDASDRKFALKIFNNSQNITIKFLTEISNADLFSRTENSLAGVMQCIGISQDPITKNYMMVMNYMNKGNLRESLQSKNNELDLENKIGNLYNIANGLHYIHDQNLVHHDFHSGNILNISNKDISSKTGYSTTSYIADLGLSQSINFSKENDRIIGVLPYVAPEVLKRGNYTKASDVYSWGVVAYEYLSQAYPYFEYQNLNNNELAKKICQGLRPNADELKIPQLLKDLIKSCWDNDPEKRPTAKNFFVIIGSWWEEIRYKKNTEFYQQYKEIEDEYNSWSQNTPYQIHHNIITYSQPINTQEIARLFQESEEQALAEEINKIEKEIDQSLNNEIKEMIKDFIQTFKKLKKNKKNKEMRHKVKELDKSLQEKEISKEKLQTIIRYCERFIEAEKQLEKEQLAQIEIPTK